MTLHWNRGLRGFACALVLGAIITPPATPAFARQTAVGTAFTYQGELKQGGTPYSGAAEFRFRLYDALTGGAQVGPTLLFENVNGISVAEGQFAANLDFGAVFAGAARWLEIDVRTGLGPYTTLTPRQRLAATPYALHALSAGAVPDAALSGTYSSPLTFSNASGSFSGTLSGNGASITNLSATNISSGNLNIVNMPTGGAWSPTSDINIDASTLFVDTVNNRVGIGTITPNKKLDVAGDLGVQGSLSLKVAPSDSGFLVLGTSTDYRIVAFDARALALSTGTSPFLSTVRMWIAPDGDVGIGLNGFPPDPGARLEVEAASDTGVGVKVRGKDSQTANLQEWLSSTGTVLASVGPSGNVGIGNPTPTAKLDIGGVAGTDGIRFPDGSLQTRAAGILRANITFDLASIAAGGSVSINFAVSGVVTGQVAMISPGADLGGLIICNARVSAADTVRVTFINPTAAPINPASMLWHIAVIE